MGAFVCFVLRICLLLLSIFDSFVASTEISSKTPAVKQEPDDANYYQVNNPGNDTTFHMCFLSHERIDLLSVDLSMPLFLLSFGYSTQRQLFHTCAVSVELVLFVL